MFGVFVYLFSAAVSFFATRRFWRAWKQSGSAAHWEFGAFFLSLGIGLVVTGVSPFFSFPLSGVLNEIGDAFILGAFAFGMRAFVRFQAMTTISPDFATVTVLFVTLVKLVVGLIFPAEPILKDSLIYWQFPVVNAFIFGGAGILLTTLFALTLFSNIRNVTQHKLAIFFLGSAFLVGGVGWILVVTTNTFVPLFAAFCLLLLTFLFVLLFTLTLSKEGTKQ